MAIDLQLNSNSGRTGTSFNKRKPSRILSSTSQFSGLLCLPMRKVSVGAASVLETRSMVSTKTFGIKKINNYVMMKTLG